MKWSQIKQLAVTEYKSRNLPKEYFERLKFEIKEIEKQGFEARWEEKFDTVEKVSNKNGLVLTWLIGKSDIDPIAANVAHSVYYSAEWPDIDVDFVPEARNIINEYAAEHYGHDKVCRVGAWQTFKPKLAIQDAARALGVGSAESRELTKNLPDEFDDLEKEIALKDYEQFAEFYKSFPEVVDLAYRMVSRIKTQGKHAGGIIISSVPLIDHIPLTMSSSADRELGRWASSWTEGRNLQLSKFGFIKFDLLGVRTIGWQHECRKRIEINHGIKIDWSDMSPENNRAGWIEYPDGTRKAIPFDDPESLKIANNCQMETIFQFETDLATSIIAKGGVKSFNDLVAYTSLGRPGPLPMVDVYIARRDGEEWKSTTDPKIVDMLSDTYGIIVFQEQLATMWRTFAGFTAPDAEKARKAVAKKWEDQLKPIEMKWIEGASKTIGLTEAREWWDKMVTFGRYAFNKCLVKGTVVTDVNGKCVKIEDAAGVFLESSSGPDYVKDVHYNGLLPIYEVKFNNGIVEKVTSGHRYLTDDGWVEVANLLQTHAIKYISGGMSEQINNRRRKECCSTVSAGSIIPEDNRYDKEIFVGQYDQQDNKKVWCEKNVFDKSGFGGESYLSGDFNSGSMLLVGISDGRWICKQQSWKFFVGTPNKRCGFSIKVCGIFRHETNSDKIWDSKSDCIKQEISSRIVDIWNSSEKVREGEFADITVYGGLRTGIYRWRWNGNDKWERISNNWSRFEFELNIRNEEIDNETCTRVEEQQNCTKKEYCEYSLASVDWIRAMQKACTMVTSKQWPIITQEKTGNRLYIESVKFVGEDHVYSPEMLSDSHDYSIAPNHPIAANSHAAAYTVITYRCLWFKAHFLPEWWASVLSDPPHRDKLVRWMGIARLEGVKFGTLDVNKLSVEYTVHKDRILPGLSMVKGIGANMAKSIVVAGEPIKDIHDYIKRFGSSKTIIERLVKLGAFDKLHASRKALWLWWQCKYGKDEECRELKRHVQWSLAWDKAKIEQIRKTRIDAYFAEFPGRKKVPAKLATWIPTKPDTQGGADYGVGFKDGIPVDKKHPEFVLCSKIEFSLEDIERLCTENYTLQEILRFEKEYLGFFWHSPMDVFDVKGHTIAKAKKAGMTESIIECVIEKVEFKQGPKSEFAVLSVTDGIEHVKVMLWGAELEASGKKYLIENVGVRMRVLWNEKFRSFNIARGAVVLPLRQVQNAT